ncbi:NAD(P)H-dependent oxidoreductase [Flavobacterium lindanitolerans]|uniref:NADPH-quinone reductase n=1 Tax=Flavobacterium lindanitolerans TaxID=428988 RepID=A0A497U4L9_9FLAO|nr:NAD(P)H-dependent oxidoreductase [Flavobacterium lindanitolerans]MBC8643987.1 NAD(P)H-dependent oxidoreductase [Flavobacterium lindanitolerans]PKW20226.1 putative NADPH-quinone reductase [Flavobacterium lindanitolerans]RLJ23815.1 putative NADPH-quinone reductase [Flavobacterium lindanitolerans]
MKTLVVVIHPNLQESVINKRWIEELEKYPDHYFIHRLYDTYPDEKIDVAKEQKLIESYDKIVFQFPFYWFNCPPLFKKWLDEVLTHGWAYGSKSGYKMGGKKIAMVLSVGVDEEEYRADGKYKYTLRELTTPFELTFEYIKADYRYFFAYYGIELNATDEWIEKSVPDYRKFLESL